MKEIDKDFYLVEEIASKLRISKMTVYRYIEAGKLKANKLGKEFRISTEDFADFLEKTKV
ncbi:helix-turn-helix domain-containing protein [Patescibacteria group bacterium]|nr:helix-turn-helix domain-containing protein [Patescibacteria group bacterium]MBU1721874.1 helix-turn-helix domain-containing protein [Patescibacteria group bacterium]MBU1901332.1 helix-turn-helix domain-containing protein [Patescibacteria group bacterium]